MKRKILVIDDEAPIRKFLRVSLSDEDTVILEAERGEDGVRAVAVENPDVVLLDLGLPDIDGGEVLRRIREWSSVPVIVLSARDEETQKILALDSGADDYLTKPFTVGELDARIRVALRRREEPSSSPLIRVANVEIDLAKRTVKKDGAEIHLTPLEFKLLALLARHSGRVLTHKQILTEVWGAAYSRQNHYLRVFMGQLRHKLEADPAQPKFLTTESGVGYRFRSE